MLNHIFRKGLWRNKIHLFWFMFSGGTLAALALFIDVYETFIENIITEKQGNMVVAAQVSASFSFVYLLMEVFLILAGAFYMRTRVREYEVYHLMGLEKKQRKRLMLLEICVITMGSLIIGAILGSGLAFGIREVFGALRPEYLEYFHIGIETYKSMGMYVITEFIMLTVTLEGIVFYLGLDAVIKFGKKSGKEVKEHPLLWKLAMVILLIALFMQSSYWGQISRQNVLFVAAVGIYLFYISVCGSFLKRRKKNEEKYYRSVIWLNSWYQRFFGNISIVFMVTVLIFMTIFSNLLSLGDVITGRDGDYYPYDVVWMTEKDSLEILEQLKNEYGITYTVQECIYLTTPDFGEHIGISATDYEKLTGEKVELENQEVAVNYQRKQDERNSVGIDYGNRTPRIYIGTATPDLWIDVPQAGVIPSAKFETTYRQKPTGNQIIFGAFAGADNENILVFADEFIKEHIQNEQSNGMVAAIQIEDNYEEIMEEIYSYIDIKVNSTHRFYEKETLLKNDEVNRLLYVVIYLISMLLLVGCGVLLVVIKMGNDSEEMEKKYQFYCRMGMDESMWKRAAKKENSVGIILSVCSGIVAGSVYLMHELSLRNLSVTVMKEYGLLLLLAIMSILIIYLIVAKVGNRSLIRKVRGGR